MYCQQYINKYARLEVALQLIHAEQLLIEFVRACSLTIDELLPLAYFYELLYISLRLLHFPYDGRSISGHIRISSSHLNSPNPKGI